MKKFFNAFTLSEVLITLAIVGVVSALTLPSVIQNIQDKQFRNKFKKAYSAFSQALLMIKNEGGEIVRANTAAGIADIYCKIAKQMKTVGMVQQNCGLSFPKIKWHDDLKWFTKDGRAFDLSGSTYRKLYVFQTTDNALYFYSCIDGTIIVDVNGHKKPNVVGRDIYYFTLTSNGNLNVKPITIPQCHDREKAPRAALNSTNYKTDCLTGTGWGCSVMTINNEL